MSNNAHVNDDEIEIHQLPEVTALQSGMMVAVDSQPTGTKCFNLTTALEGKASASDFTALETTVSGKADASDVVALETAVSGKADADAMTTALAGKEDKVFIAEYNVTSYDDIETAYNAGKQILCHYTSNQSDLYIKLSMKTPVANGGMMFNGLITYTESCWIRVWKENNETRWYQKNYSLVYQPTNPSNGQVLSYTNDGTVYAWKDIKEVPPSTAADSGKVLSVDSNGTTRWENPPEGVYVLNYSEVTDISDIDINRSKSQPTFLLVDESGHYIEISHTAKAGQTSNRIDIPVGMTFRLTEMVDNMFTFTSPYTGTFYGGTTNGDRYNGIIKISLYTHPGETYLYKSINYEGSINNGALNRNMSMPYNVYYSGDEDYGTWDSNAIVNSGVSLTKMYEFNGKARKQIELPPTVLTRVLGSDTQIPTQKIFLGLDILGNQSDPSQYRFGSMIPFNVASQVDNNAYPYQTPTLTLQEFVMGNPSGELDADQRNLSISTTLLDSLGSNTRNINYLFLPNTSNAIDANIVPNVPKYWTDSKGGHIDWKPVNEVPASTSAESGKVLTVAANGTPGWGNAISFIKNVGVLTDAATITASNLNNGFATLSTSQSALTIIDVVGTDEIVNFAIEITPSVNCTLTIKKKVGSGEAVTLKHAVAAGNTLDANKTYQVTAVGTCWTLAEFEA